MDGADRARLLLADHYLRVCDRTGLLICSKDGKHCGVAMQVDRKIVSHHLRSYHSTGVAVNKAIVSAASKLAVIPGNADLRGKYEKGGASQGVLPRLEGLPVLSSKECRCCDRLFVNDSTLRTHMSRVHKIAPGPEELKSIRSQQSQSLGKMQKLRPFLIAELVAEEDSEVEYDPGAVVVNEDAEVEDMFQGVFPSAAKVQERLKESGLKLKEAGWLVGPHSEWNEEDLGKKLTDVKGCLRDFCDEAKKLCGSTQVTDNFHVMIQTGSATRKNRKFKFLGVDGPGEARRKDGNVPRDVLQRYMDSLCLIVRIALLVCTQQSELEGVYMAPEMRQAAVAVLEKDSRNDAKGFQDAVFNLVFAVFTEKKEDDAQDGKVLFAYIVAACLCVKQDRRRTAQLCDSTAVSPRLSGVLYGASCLFAVYVLKYHPEGDGNQAAKEKIKDVTNPEAECGLSYFTDLRSLCACLRTSEAKHNPFTVCNEHAMCGVFNGTEFSARQYGQCVKRMHRAIRKKMFEGLFNGKDVPEQFWSKVKGLVEDTGKDEVGYWALADVRNDAFIKVCVQWSKKAADVKCLVGDLWKAWRNKALDVLLDIMIAAHISGGGPSRGTELGSLTLRNTPTGMRTVYLGGQEVMMMPFYNKTRGMTHGKIIVLTRHLDQETSALFRAFFVLVHPLLVIQEEKSPTGRPEDPVRNVRDCLTLGAWPAVDMATQMGKKLTEYGIPFQFSEFRHHQRGLVKAKKESTILGILSRATEEEDHAKDMTDDPMSVGEAAFKQAGHTETTAELIYAQIGKSGKLNIEQEKSKIEMFRQASEEWHVELGLRGRSASAQESGSQGRAGSSKKSVGWNDAAKIAGEVEAPGEVSEGQATATEEVVQRSALPRASAEVVPHVPAAEVVGGGSNGGVNHAQSKSALATLLAANPDLAKALAAIPKDEVVQCVENLQGSRTVLAEPSASEAVSRQGASDEDTGGEDGDFPAMDEVPGVELEALAHGARGGEGQVSQAANIPGSSIGGAAEHEEYRGLPVASPETVRSGHKFPENSVEEGHGVCAARRMGIVPQRLVLPDGDGVGSNKTSKPAEKVCSAIWDRFRNGGKGRPGSLGSNRTATKSAPPELTPVREVCVARSARTAVHVEKSRGAVSSGRGLGEVAGASEGSARRRASGRAGSSQVVVPGPKKIIGKKRKSDLKRQSQQLQTASRDVTSNVDARMEDLQSFLDSEAADGGGSVADVLNASVSVVVGEYGRRTHERRFDALQALRQVTHRGAEFKTEGQRKAMLAVVDRRGDLAVILKTGEGKTAVVMGPVLWEKGVTVWVCPLRALRWETQRRLKACRVEVFGWNEVPMARVKQGMGMVCLVSPEEMLLPEFADLMLCLHTRGCLSRVVVDEAHLAVMSESYRKSFTHLKSLAKHGTMCPIVMLTATAPPAMLRQIADVCGSDMQGLEIHRGDPCRANLKLTVVAKWLPNMNVVLHYVSGEAHGLAQDLKRAGGERARCIIVCLTIKDAVELDRILRKDCGHICDVLLYHSSRPQAVREVVMRRWQAELKDGELRVIVATEGFTTGTDAGSVRLVMFPGGSRSLVEFWQAAGRGARDGGTCKVKVFYLRSEVCKAVGDDRGFSGAAAGLFTTWAEEKGTCRRVGIEQCLTGSSKVPTCKDRRMFGTEVQFCDVCDGVAESAARIRAAVSCAAYISSVVNVKRPSAGDIEEAREKQRKRARTALTWRQSLRKTGKNLSKLCPDHLLELFQQDKRVVYANQDTRTILKESYDCGKGCTKNAYRCFRCMTRGHPAKECPVFSSICKDPNTGKVEGYGICRECRLSSLGGENPHEKHEFGNRDCPLKPCVDLMMIAWSRDDIRRAMKHPEKGVRWRLTREGAEEDARSSGSRGDDSWSPSSSKQFGEWLTVDKKGKLAGICIGLQWLFSHLPVDISMLEM